jgi:hypothetical protein
MKHLTQEQIVLHFYGDADDNAQVLEHLNACRECREEFERVSSLLGQIEPIEVPEPAAGFEQKTWLNLRDRLPESPGSALRRFLSPPKWALAGVMAMIVIVAFLAGRYLRPCPPTIISQPPDTQANVQRGMLMAVGNHLERSQILLVEIMHTEPGDHDISREQAQARDLLDSNRLYRAGAQKTGDPSVGRTLDELERVLAEIANGPTETSAADLQRLQHQIESQGLLLKMRVIGSKVQHEESSPVVNQGSKQGNQRL